MHVNCNRFPFSEIYNQTWSTNDSLIFHSSNRGQLWNRNRWVWVQSLQKWCHLPWPDWNVFLPMSPWVWRNRLWSGSRWMCQWTMPEWRCLSRHGKQVNHQSAFNIYNTRGLPTCTSAEITSKPSKWINLSGINTVSNTNKQIYDLRVHLMKYFIINAEEAGLYLLGSVVYFFV